MDTSRRRRIYKKNPGPLTESTPIIDNTPVRAMTTFVAWRRAHVISSMRFRATRTLCWLLVAATASTCWAGDGPRQEQPKGQEPRLRLGAIPPTEPDDAVRTFRLQKGFRIELVAAEPLIRDPYQTIRRNSRSDYWLHLSPCKHQQLNTFRKLLSGVLRWGMFCK